MTPRPAPSNRRLRAALALTLLSLALVAPRLAEARPLDLSTDDGVAELARWVEDYRSVKNSHWVIAAKDLTEAQAKRSALAALLLRRDLELIDRVDLAIADGPPHAWMNPVVGGISPTSSCSWQVWVEDPAVPGPGDGPVLTQLAPNDRIVVGSDATFRVGHAGLVQSHLYAFGETRVGALRDLASAPDVNIPATRDPDGETIMLASARQASPFFESVKTALAQSQGERVELGPRYDIREKMRGGARGIGANIQAIPDSMIASADPPRPVASEPKESVATALLESCIYQMAPRP
jgi:hypothetical protein